MIPILPSQCNLTEVHYVGRQWASWGQKVILPPLPEGGKLELIGEDVTNAAARDQRAELEERELD